ncbi:hypothetical protein RFI_17357 [Reticulomyxa filosa]|uniref:Uncharacterized protein n=1 Tax=Reticulomyxa filosa TaxID=46433 RepID=X6N1X9_RETFI|nr:hypothetical protein RFI_17357 [Reticulomyxa filosa]|eukprot:ETO19873.1 hypothetical protein RFI_17357 [Reticulomyxa filosa]
MMFPAKMYVGNAKNLWRSVDHPKVNTILNFFFFTYTNFFFFPPPSPLCPFYDLAKKKKKKKLTFDRNLNSCKICELQSAFNEEVCRHCANHKERFGEPMECDNCHKRCAWKKDDNSTDKLGGKNLCFVCTREYKLQIHRETFHYTLYMANLGLFKKKKKK